MKRRFFPALAVIGVLLIFAGSAYSAPCTDPGSIRRVVKTRNGAYEYVVFDVFLPPNPTYTVTTAHPPFVQDGSGEPVTVTGPNYKSVRFTGVNWMCTIGENFSVPTTTIKQIKSLGQFEGIVEYVIGYKKASKYAGNYFYDVGSIRKVVVRFKR
jgi:hypothetical protein